MSAGEGREKPLQFVGPRLARGFRHPITHTQGIPDGLCANGRHRHDEHSDTTCGAKMRDMVTPAEGQICSVMQPKEAAVSEKRQLQYLPDSPPLTGAGPS